MEEDLKHSELKPCYAHCPRPITFKGPVSFSDSVIAAQSTFPIQSKGMAPCEPMVTVIPLSAVATAGVTSG